MWERAESLWLDETALRLVIGRERLGLGRWDRRFGAWRDDGSGFCPDWPLLDADGVWRVPNAGHPDAPALLAAYFSLIPTPIRRLAAPFGNAQWLVLEALWHRPGLRHDIDDIIAAGGAARLACTLEQSRLSEGRDRLDFVERAISAPRSRG